MDVCKALSRRKQGFESPRERQKSPIILGAAGNAIRPPVTPLVTSSPERADLGDRTHPAANQSTKRVSWSTGLPIAAER